MGLKNMSLVSQSMLTPKTAVCVCMKKRKKEMFVHVLLVFLDQCVW